MSRTMTQVGASRIEPSTGRQRVLAGTAAVAFLLATGRWGAHIGAAPIFLTDVLIVAAVVWLATRLRPSVSMPVPVRLHRLVGLFCALGVLRLAIAGELSLIILRDFVPYAYAGLALVAGVSHNASSPAQRNRTFGALLVALTFHAVWVAVATVVPERLAAMPKVASEIGLFQTRPDFDVALLGVLAATCLWLVIRREGGLAARVTFLLLTYLLATSGTRAGFLGGAAALVTVVWAVLRSREVSSKRRMRLVAAGFLVAPLIVLVLPSADAGVRLLSTVGVATDADVGSGAGTAEARSRAWSTVTAHMAETVPRMLFGVGFGPDYMADSGAIIDLVGNGPQEARAPHNYALNTYARLGLVGMLVWLALVLSALRSIRAASEHFAREPLLLLSTLIIVGLLPPAIFGVVLESPFGAVPFYWALGILLSWRSVLMQQGAPQAVGRYVTSFGTRPGAQAEV